MITLESGLYVRVEEMEGVRAPTPVPLHSGFSLDTAYRAIGLYNPSESSEAYVILSNDRDEIWFISNRHLRTVGFSKNEAFRLPLTQFTSKS